MESGAQHSDQAIIVALGSNLAGEYPSVQALLEAALGVLEGAGLRVVRRSRWWRSAAWPDSNDPPYLNGVAIIDTELGPAELVERLHELETQFGRDRKAPNAPRTLDLDLIAYGRKVLNGTIVVPHPRAADRLFVMGPLAEMAPEWRHPIYRETAAVLAERARVGADAAPLSEASSTDGL